MNRKGFSQVILLGIIAVLVLAGAGGFLVFSGKRMPVSEKTVRQIEDSTKLGELCSGENGCSEYCKNNLGHCKEYCRMHPENTLCQTPFSFEASDAKETVIPIDNKTVDKIVPAPTPPATTITPTTVIPQIKKFEIAKPQPWVFDSMTQPVPPGASKTRLTSLPAPLDKILIDGPFGAHRGGHPEGLDHEWIGIPDDTPVLSWADGKVTQIFLNNPDVPNDWRIYIDYGDGLSGEHMDVKTPLVKTGNTVKAGQAIAYGKTQPRVPEYHSGEFNLVDTHRRDGINSRDGVNVSPFDYLREDIKQELIADFTKKYIEPYVQRGEFFKGFEPWEPYLTNPMLFHKMYKGTLAGEWLLKSKKWENDTTSDLIIFFAQNTKYYNKQKVLATESEDWRGSFLGTWEADYNKKQFVITTEDVGENYGKELRYYGIFELDESAPRAILKLEYQRELYPTGFSDKANTYIERDGVGRRQDGYNLGVRDTW